MSLEQLLLFAFLIAMALLGRLIRALRARTSPPPSHPPLPRRARDVEGEAFRTARPGVATPSSRAPPTRAPQHAAAERHLPADGAWVPRERQGPEAAPTAAARLLVPMRHGIALEWLGAGGNLRRAIVLMAILGPCRSLHSSDASDRPS